MFSSRLSLYSIKINKVFFSRSSNFELKVASTTKMGSGDTTFVDQLLKKYPALRVKDKDVVENKLKTIFDGGKEKLQLIVDFDNTLTRHHKNGNLTDCSWGVMENSPLLPKDYTDKTNALRSKYLPIEQDPNLTIAEKIPHMEAWYKRANELLQEAEIKKEMFGQFVKTSNVEFRDHTKYMLD